MQVCLLFRIVKCRQRNLTEFPTKAHIKKAAQIGHGKLSMSLGGPHLLLKDIVAILHVRMSN